MIARAQSFATICDTRMTFFEDLVPIITLLYFIFGSITFVTLLVWQPAPYGRYENDSLGFRINAQLAWFLQESPAFFIPLFMFMTRSYVPLANRILIGMFMAHYFQR